MARPTGRDRALLERDKALVLRSIKELEFDRAMGKVSEADFEEISTRLRAKALAIMEQLDADTGSAATAGSTGSAGSTGLRSRQRSGGQADACPTCGTVNDVDARFCKQCGGKLA